MDLQSLSRLCLQNKMATKATLKKTESKQEENKLSNLTT
jgi:hypothetical protein